MTESSKRRPGLAAVLMAALAGCVGSAPVVLKGDESFVTVSRPELTSKQAVRDVATAYCGQHGKHADLLSDACPDAKCAERSLTFWCR